MDVLLNLNQWDFARSADPIHRKLESPYLKSVLPILKAHQTTRQFLSLFCLVAEVKDLSFQFLNIYRGDQDWDDALSEIKVTAYKIAALSLSIWDPLTYALLVEALEFNTNYSKDSGRLKTNVQLLYLFSLFSMSSVGSRFQSATDQLLSKGGELNEQEKATLFLAPYIRCLFAVLQVCKVPKVLFQIASSPQPSDPLQACSLVVSALDIFEAASMFQLLQGTTRSKYDTLIVAFNQVFKHYCKEELAQLILDLSVIGKVLLTVSIPLLQVISLLGGVSSFKNNYHVVKTPTVKMEDVAGCSKPKKAVNDCVDQINNPKIYQALGLVTPIKGMLFYGPPGTGKTMVAQALATALGEGTTFIEQPGSSFTQLYVGQGPLNVRKLFKRAADIAKKDLTKRVVIFIDEINAIAANRSASGGVGSNKETDNTTEAFLVEMDKLPANVLVVGATNMTPDQLDPAFIRSGRLERHFKFELPTKKEREEYFTALLKQYKLDQGMDLKFWSHFETGGWSYANINHLVQEASRTAGSARQECIKKEDFEKAFENLSITQTSSPTTQSMYL